MANRERPRYGSASGGGFCEPRRACAGPAPVAPPSRGWSPSGSGTCPARATAPVRRSRGPATAAAVRRAGARLRATSPERSRPRDAASALAGLPRPKPPGALVRSHWRACNIRRSSRRARSGGPGQGPEPGPGTGAGRALGTSDTDQSQRAPITAVADQNQRAAVTGRESEPARGPRGARRRRVERGDMVPEGRGSAQPSPTCVCPVSPARVDTLRPVPLGTTCKRVRKACSSPSSCARDAHASRATGRNPRRCRRGFPMYARHEPALVHLRHASALAAALALGPECEVSPPLDVARP